MSVNDLLTQEEIDALLNGQSSDDIISSDKELSDESDVAIEEEDSWGNNSHIPALAVLNRRYAQLFQQVFFNLLRKETSVSVFGVNLLNAAEYIDGLYTPSSLNVVRMSPLQGMSMFVFDPDLVFMIVENYFGGDGRFRSKQKKTKITPIELRLIELLLDKMFVVLRKAWEPVMPLEFELISSEVNSEFQGVENPDESVVVTTFNIEIPHELGHSQKGELQISTPYSLLEDILGTDV